MSKPVIWSKYSKEDVEALKFINKPSLIERIKEWFSDRTKTY